ncbi:hypothetical protein FOMPIDRAFT_1052802 [Fomitopsis schrenkii]|uniref:Autophagy-related protein n=1 Tax=Fomitopsis schrenkii TaxID=2126942 RepID=S8DWF5_FOMSC|nr:hypothetical protein FOMPIDRAFT_1052802 [Fomitopsis schrenkii]
MSDSIVLLPEDVDDITKYDEGKHTRHFRGWLSYAFASEVFVIVSLTLFLPICLEQFARDNGYLLPDLKIGWAWIDTASFSLYVYSISVALQALTVISMGGIADHPPHRKRLLFAFAALGSISAMFFLAIPSSSLIWPAVGLLAICANVGFGASFVALNAYIPSLARSTREVTAAQAELVRLRELHAQRPAAPPTPSISDADADSGWEPLLAPPPADTDHPDVLAAKLAHDTALSAATARISSHGIALGYGAGIALLLLALIPVTRLGGSTFALRLAVGLSGAWWALFSLPAALWLPSAASARITLGAEVEREEWSAWREIVGAWKRLGGMLRWREIKRLRNTFVYLAAWFLLSDGFTTITSTALLFGKTTLGMPPSALILIGVLTPTAGILGSILWPILQRRLRWSNLRILVVLVIMASLIPAYGCLGFLPVFQSSGVKFGGLTTWGEMYVLAVYFGAVYGAFQGYARAFYAELIPPGEEARWYGLFSITDKSSSFVGPLFVGLIADTTGNIRYAFFFLVFMVWLAVPILMCVDVERGRDDAMQYTYAEDL